MNSRRQDILSSSASLFRKRGFKATSLKDIAKAVGIEAPSLYNHIKSKDDILSSILLELANTFSEGINQIDQSSLTGYQKMEKIIAHYIQVSLVNTNEVSLLTGEWIHLKAADQKIYLKHRDDYEKVFRKVLKQCIKEGSVVVENEDLTVFSILSTLRWIYSWIGRNPKYNPLELEMILTKVLLEGIKSNR